MQLSIGHGRGATRATVVLACLAAVPVGALIARSPLLAIAAVAATLVGAAVARSGRLLVAELTLGLLPWLVVFDEFVPALVRTVTTAIAAIALVALVWPLRFARPTVVIAASVFIVVVLAHALFAATGEQLIQACKYLIFPTVVLAVLSEGAREQLPRLRDVVFASAVAAMVCHLVVVGLGLGSTGGYYGLGEKLGFAPASPQDLGLLGVTVAAAGIVIARRTTTQIVLFAVGAVPALLTGVRAGLVAGGLILLVFLVRTGMRPRSVAVVAAIVGLMLASGAVNTVAERFSSRAGEFSSFESAGSGRGQIYTIALESWDASGPRGWLFGTGLRSIADAELRESGIALVGHSDVLEIAVQFGVVLFAAWLVLWWCILNAPVRNLVLVPLIVYALITGGIERVAPLTLALVLAAACGTPQEEPVARRRPRPQLRARGAVQPAR